MTLSHQFDLTADLGKQFNQVAKLINVSDTLDTERGAYYGRSAASTRTRTSARSSRTTSSRSTTPCTPSSSR